MKSPWRLYLAATLVGVLAGLVGAAFHALLDAGADERAAIHAQLSGFPFPGWLILMGLGALVLVSALWLVRRFAPETAGSGVQEVEAILAGDRSLRWRRVLPVKFVAGTLAVGSGLVLGREGPTIHMGAALGQMAGERFGLRPGDHRALIAAGAAGGLATAFNAPLASIVFVTEELREHFEYRFETIQSVVLACCAAVVVSGWLLGQGPDMPMPALPQAPLATAPLFLILGLLIGVLGVLFNRLVVGSVQAFRALGGRRGDCGAYLASAFSGALLGGLLWFAPATVGGGEHMIESLLHGHPGLLFLLGLLAVRLLTTVGSYGLGLPGGIFAPMLALGTLCGAAFAVLVAAMMPALALEPAVFAVAAMGALFAATVRAPITGIILVIELTGAQTLALPIILTCLSATFTAEGLGGRPIYSDLLGLSKRTPPRKPVRRIAIGAAILAAFIAAEQFDVRWHDAGITPARPLVDAALPVTATASKPTMITPSAHPHPPFAPIPAEGPIKARAEPAGSAPRLPVTAAATRHPDPEAEAEASRYSIQLISFRERASLARFVEQEGLVGEARTRAERAPHQRWHAVLIGSYATRAAAIDALQRLPDRLRRLDPTIRALVPGTRLVPIHARGER